MIAPYDYAYQDLNLGPSGPSAEHLLGTDTLGRDLLTRMMYGSRISLMVGFLATMVALVIGVLWGTIAGFAGGRTDAVMMRIVDVLYGIPFIILDYPIDGYFWKKSCTPFHGHWCSGMVNHV